MAKPVKPFTSRIATRTAATCAALLAMFALLSWLAVSEKSSTFDEPVHALGSWLALYHGDFRLDPGNPPLWQHWAALGNGPAAIRIDTSTPGFSQILHESQSFRFPFTVDWLYRTPGNDGEQFVSNSRRMMLPIGVALGAVIALWGWKTGGSIGAIAATALYCFDPNFLAHAALVKNDVPLTAAMTWAMLATWQAGQRLTIARLVSLALAVGVAITTKYSGLVVLPIVSLLLLIRAMQPVDWPMLSRPLISRPSRLLAAISLILVIAAFSYAMIWASYHFRFDPTNEPGAPLDRQEINQQAQANASPVSIFQLANFASAHRLLPDAYVQGLLFQSIMLKRETFLCGQHGMTGWWYYFPLAMLFKTPVATLSSIFTAGVAAIWSLRRRWPCQARMWSVLCLIIPFMIFLSISMRSNLNIGLRHVFPLYPLLYVATGAAIAWLYRLRPWLTKLASFVLAIMLAAESFSAFPDYLAYFNFPAGGSAGGIRLLGDSNLDWGQDLPSLAIWQQKHPKTPLYLAYFGIADPQAYGLEYVSIAGGYLFSNQPGHPMDQPGVLAISATFLQGTNASDPVKAKLDFLNQRPPREILGGSIYLYDWDPAAFAAYRARLAKP